MTMYQEIECQLTFEEALQEYHKINSELFYDREMAEDSQAFFRSHDIAHVIFACDISLLNEAMVKTWTAFELLYRMLHLLWTYVRKAWRRWLGRRHRNGYISMEKFKCIEATFPLPRPRIIHNI